MPPAGSGTASARFFNKMIGIAKRPEPAQRGFTLVELVVTVLLLSILAAALWQRAPARESLTLLGRAEQLASDIRYAQALSMTTGERHCLVFEPSSGPPYTGYRLRRDASCASAAEHPAGATQPVAVCLGAACVSAAGIAAGQLQFDGLGVPQSPAGTALGGAAVITLADDGGSRQITVSPQTGRVRVQ